MNTRRFYHTHNHDVIMFMYHVFQSHAVREAMSEVYVHQDEQETTKKAPYLLTNPFTFTFHLPKVLLMHLFR